MHTFNLFADHFQSAYQFAEADKVWNRACGQGECSSPGAGDSALAALLMFHGFAMCDGVLYGLEIFSEVQIAAAADGFRFFGLVEAASVIETGLLELRRIQTHGENRAEVGTLELALEDRYATHANDRIVEEAFKRFFELHRSEFQPL